MNQAAIHCGSDPFPLGDAELQALLQKVAGDSASVIAEQLRTEWIDSVAALKALSEDGWVELDLPVGLEQALRSQLSSPSCHKVNAKSIAALPVPRRRHSLPNRRRTCADGPPPDIFLRGWGGHVPSRQNQPKEQRPVQRQHQVSADVGIVNKARWLLHDVQKEFRIQGHVAQVCLAKRFQLLSVSVGEGALVSALLEQRLACLCVAGDAELLVMHCFGPFPALKDKVLAQLRGCDRSARQLAIRDAFARLAEDAGGGAARLSAHSLRQSFAPKQHPTVRSRGQSGVDALMAFHELLSAEGVAKENKDISADDLARVCGALGVHVERDDTFDDFLRSVFPCKSDTASEPVSAMIARLCAGLQEASLEQLELIASMAHVALTEGSPEGLLSRPDFPAIGGGIILSLPESSHPLFGGYHGRFFRGNAFRGLPPERRTAHAPERAPKRGPLHRPGFVLWLESWRLPGISGAVAECLFAHFDADASGELDLDEVRCFLAELAGKLTDRRQGVLDQFLARASSPAEALRLEMLAEFVGPCLKDDASFQAWLSTKAG